MDTKAWDMTMEQQAGTVYLLPPHHFIHPLQFLIFFFLFFFPIYLPIWVFISFFLYPGWTPLFVEDATSILLHFLS